MLIVFTLSRFKSYNFNRNLQKALKFKLKLSKLKFLLVFKMFAGRTNASGGSHTGRVFETHGIEPDDQ